MLEEHWCTYGAFSAGPRAYGLEPFVVNALSSFLTVTVERAGRRFVQSFSRGRPVSPLLEAGRTKGQGTTVQVLLDSEIFGALPPELHQIRALRDLPYLHPGLRIEANGRAHVEPTGLAAFVRHAAHGPVNGVRRIETERGDVRVRAAMGKGRGALVGWFDGHRQDDDSPVMVAASEVVRGANVVVAFAVEAPDARSQARSSVPHEAAEDAVRDVVAELLDRS